MQTSYTNNNIDITYFEEYVNSKISYKHCVDTILDLKGKYKKFYIGATHNPDSRIVEHMTKNLKKCIFWQKLFL